uniref:Uncharacterized protein n=1 Tax=Propithecus coquereli TaxID=379532 RepID=A0A2K6GHY6_PROCO
MASKLLSADMLRLCGLDKGTVCQRIAQNFGLQHLYSGHSLRENIKTNTEVGDTAKQCIEKGLLVPCHVITRLLPSELENRRSQHWLLDGFPTTLGQAEALDKICDLDLVIILNIPFETLKDCLRRLQQEDDKPEAAAARLRQYRDVAKPVTDSCKSRGVCHQCSGTETNKI